MARVIEEQDGPEAVVRVAWEGPIAFFRRYIALSQAHPDKIRYRFDAETEKTIDKMAHPAKPYR